MGTIGITGAEPDARLVYADVIDHPHYEPKKHPRMSLYNRAAQFAAFDALVGFSDMITEEARVTDGKTELSEGELEKLNQKLTLINDVIEDGGRPEITVIYFVPDKRKAGGSYEELTGAVKKIDTVERKLVFCAGSGVSPGVKIDLAAITEIHGELVDYLDDTLL